MRPSRRGLLLVVGGSVTALLPVLVDPRLWTLWPVMLGGLLLAFGLDALLSPVEQQIGCELEAPDSLYIGRADRASLTLSVPSRWSLPLELACDLSDDLEPVAQLRGTTSASGTRFELPLVARRRGVAVLERVWVRWPGPLGLILRSATRPLDREIAVRPDILAVRSAALRFSLDPEYRVGLRIERFRGEGTEFDSLREFVQGDDLRAMDWKSSAKHLKLMCRQFRAERNRQVILAIDSGQLMSERLQGIPKLDHALNAGLLLSYVSLRSGDRTGFFTFDARVGAYLEPQSGMRAMEAIHLASTRVAYSDAETNYTLGLATLSQRVRRRSLVVVVTDFVDTVTAELMLENLDRLARRHLVVFVALRDPELERISAAEPGDSLRLNRAVVAQNFLRDRQVVLGRLRRGGIRAIDTEPRQVGTSLINAYLEVKRRELI